MKQEIVEAVYFEVIAALNRFIEESEKDSEPMTVIDALDSDTIKNIAWEVSDEIEEKIDQIELIESCYA